MSRRTRYLLVLLVGVVLVNLPLVHSTWTDQRVDRSGVDVRASVTHHEVVGAEHLLTFRFSPDIDPRQRTWQADVDPSTYAAAVASGRVEVRVLEDDPAAYTVAGEVGSRAIVVVTVVADALLALVVLLLWRFGLSRRPQLQAVAMEDVRRSAPGTAFDRVGGETFLVRGDVLEVAPDRVVIDLGGRSIVVLLDGHDNPVGHQQAAQVLARLV